MLQDLPRLLNPNGLDVCELSNAMRSQFPPVARLLDSPKWNTRLGWHHLVREHTPGLEFVDEALTLPIVLGPGTRPQPEAAVIGNSNGFLDIPHAKDRRHRTEKLILVCGRILRNVRQHGGRIVIARAR